MILIRRSKNALRTLFMFVSMTLFLSSEISAMSPQQKQIGCSFILTLVGAGLLDYAVYKAAFFSFDSDYAVMMHSVVQTPQAQINGGKSDES